MQMSPVKFTLTPRIVFDLRDWYRTTFTSNKVPAGASSTASIVRAKGEASFVVSPADPPHPKWPFGGAMELVIQESGNGIRAFHGRVKTLDGVLFNRMSRQIVAATTCKLSIRVRGFQPHFVDPFDVPGSGDECRVLPPIDLFPAVDYSFPSGLSATVVSGRVLRAGRPVRDAELTLRDADGKLLPGGSLQTNGNGEWWYFADARLSSESDEDGDAVGIAVRSNDQFVFKDVIVHSGQRNFLPAISLPEN